MKFPMNSDILIYNIDKQWINRYLYSQIRFKLKLRPSSKMMRCKPGWCRVCSSRQCVKQLYRMIILLNSNILIYNIDKQWSKRRFLGKNIVRWNLSTSSEVMMNRLRVYSCSICRQCRKQLYCRRFSVNSKLLNYNIIEYWMI